MAQKERNIFRLKQFALANRRGAMKITTDSILLGALAPAVEAGGRIADVGAGTGIISMMMAQRCGDAEIFAFEIDEEGYKECVNNFASSQWAYRLRAVAGDFTVTASGYGMFDLIVSNPPFFNTDTRSPDSRRAAARHEGTLTLESLMSIAAKILKPDGKISMIVPHNRIADLEFYGIIYALNQVEIIEIAPSPDKEPIRAVVTFSKNNTGSLLKKTRLDLRDSSGEYSEQYRRLTKDFYLDF